jgi:hypothetical protein
METEENEAGTGTTVLFEIPPFFWLPGRRDVPIIPETSTRNCL